MDYAAAILGRLPGGSRAAGIGELVAELETYLPEEDLAGIIDAYEFASAAHQGQRRMSGESYISHPVAVARILAELHLDAGTLKAALLHDVVEDTPTAVAEINQRFGADVALLVDGVSKLDQLQFKSREEAQAESFRKMLLAMVEDLRVILVKLADRTHNMRTLDTLPLPKQRRISRETLEIYAPIANRLGINSIKVELEDLGFKALYPFRYRVLEKALNKALGNQRQFLRKIESNLRRTLAEQKVVGKVLSREKHLYSIYAKMLRKQRALADIVDVYGLRIVVEDVDTCYRVLGLVHSLYKPMPGRFKDYIAIPRVNGYQSLHTTLFGPNGIPLEVQIRTREMDRVAERGIAAHWQYKAVDKHTYSAEARAREWLKSLMEMQHAANSEEFLESVKVDLFPDKVYVFTPRGDILRLPRAATAVDFAYAVHTDVGNRCVAAKIDRRLVPLRTALQNGQTVEIITARGARPNPNWVNFVATAKARNAIRAYLRNLKGSEARDLGRRLLDQSLKAQGSSLRRVKKPRLAALLQELKIETSDALLEQIGLGERLSPVIASMLLQQASKGHAPPPALAIAGTEGMVVSYARCCYPIPGDEIIAYMSSGRGLVIHRNNCGNLAEYRKQPSKWIAVGWKRSVQGDFEAEVHVRALNRMGLLAEMAGGISSTQSNIDQVRVETDGDSVTLVFLLRVRDRDHLARVLRSIRALPDVSRVSRGTVQQQRGAHGETGDHDG